ncbi:MAG: hypothetical protein R3C56_03680 [Pirellulaceae bacterium]
MGWFRWWHYMTPIPEEWQAGWAAPYLTGQAAASIISQTSVGPAAGFDRPS